MSVPCLSAVSALGGSLVLWLARRLRGKGGVGHTAWVKVMRRRLGEGHAGLAAST